MKVFISGSISDNPNYKEEFAEAEQKLKDKYVVINPSFLPEGLDYEDYMIICLTMLSRCDAIAIHPNYINSPGACLELEYATKMGKGVLFL